MPDFIDIQKVVEDWAWTKYDENPTRKQRTLREKQNKKKRPYIAVRINWEGCEFRDETIWSKINDVDMKTPAKESSASASGGALKSSQTTGSDVNILFQTEFVNNTKSSQMYTLRIEKTTRSVCSTEVEQGVTKGYEMGISLKLPEEILEVNAGYSREVTLTNISGQSFEEELTWGAESEIKVDEHHIANAQLLVHEKKQNGDFEIISKIHGYVSVSFLNLRDNNSFLKQADGDISYIVQQFLDKKQKISEMYPFVTVDGDTQTVTITNKGCCRFRYGIRQEIRVDQTPI